MHRIIWGLSAAIVVVLVLGMYLIVYTVSNPIPRAVPLLGSPVTHMGDVRVGVAPTAKVIRKVTPTAKVIRKVTSTVVPKQLGLSIPAVGINAPIENVGVNADGSMAVPALNPWTDVGLYQNGPKPGQVGSAVIDGHLDRPGGAPAGVLELKELACRRYCNRAVLTL